MRLCFVIMHPRIRWIVLGCLAALAAQGAVIYKWVDADGVVHYSDQETPGAEKIYTSSPSRAGTVTARTAPGTPAPKKPAGLELSQFAITSPAKEQTFFGDEVIGVNLTVSPPLKPTQVITWHLNGAQISDQPPDVTSFQLPHMDRGAYVIAATITDQKSGESQTTDNVTFYVRQPSALSPQHKNP